MGILFDDPTELGDLSRRLQRHEITFYEAHGLIQMQVLVFESMTDSPGPFATNPLNAAERKQFDGEGLQQNKGCVSMKGAQFFGSLANNRRKRMTMTNASNVSRSITTTNNEREYKELEILRAGEGGLQGGRHQLEIRRRAKLGGPLAETGAGEATEGEEQGALVAPVHSTGDVKRLTAALPRAAASCLPSFPARGVHDDREWTQMGL
ncbi:hypothetical protein NDU88_006137 [Pleurodeles waltl]|uniref:Uncharacterized protein n=1 Tax=Pleurodeles waltl TaxID=8319 RepID=A0AAV7QKB7_PLEWA|nr:hypothetical protein NDU88_006137 [Pleurodeles waltl]